mgnify:CR=1 FL=1|tara:strand:+ start:53971 stop:54777 length:807 start_codon:yes stop_codon:yes gene_type:complete
MKQNYLSKLTFLLLIVLNTTMAFAQTTFAGMGAANSGGTGFKTISDVNLVVSNDFTSFSPDMAYNNTTSSSKTLTIKADGVDSDFFDFNGLIFYAFNANGITLNASSTVVFKNTSGSVIRTMTMNDDVFMAQNADMDISALFDNNMTLPVLGVASIDFNFVITGCCNNGNNFSNFTFKNITYSNPNVLSVENQTNDDATLIIFPNPSVAHIQISGLTQRENYIIYNVLGAQVINGSVFNNETIDIRDFAKGIYILKLENRNPIKFLKE